MLSNVQIHYITHRFFVSQRNKDKDCEWFKISNNLIITPTSTNTPWKRLQSALETSAEPTLPFFLFWTSHLVFGNWKSMRNISCSQLSQFRVKASTSELHHPWDFFDVQQVSSASWKVFSETSQISSSTLMIYLSILKLTMSISGYSIKFWTAYKHTTSKSIWTNVSLATGKSHTWVSH